MACTDADFRVFPRRYAAQQVCYCSSQIWENIAGCESCIVMHGSRSADAPIYNPEALSKMSSTYCAASSTPTNSLEDYLFSLMFPRTTASASPGVLGTSTDASLYFTASSVTGTDAYIVPSPTLTIAPSVKDGQIRPTAVANLETPTTSTITSAATSPASLTTSTATSHVAAATSLTTSFTSSIPDLSGSTSK